MISKSPDHWVLLTTALTGKHCQICSWIRKRRGPGCCRQSRRRGKSCWRGESRRRSKSCWRGQSSGRCQSCRGCKNRWSCTAKTIERWNLFFAGAYYRFCQNKLSCLLRRNWPSQIWHFKQTETSEYSSKDSEYYKVDLSHELWMSF